MAILNGEQYRKLLKNAKENSYCYPAINVTSSSTALAALQGLEMAKSDGIIQVTTGGAKAFAGGKSLASGAIAFAKYMHEIAENFDINIALHTDHAQRKNLEDFIIPLIEHGERSIRDGRVHLFQSHMWDGSNLPLKENLDIAKRLLKRTQALDSLLEIEIGVVGGEEDGIEAAMNTKLYSEPEDIVETVETLGRSFDDYIVAATFGNVHGLYKPGNVKLRTEILREAQHAVEKMSGVEGVYPLNLVFHGGSGSELQKIREAISYGVVKFNVDTELQYSYSRAIADHMLSNYKEVLKIDDQLANKKFYDPRSYALLAQKSMAERVREVCKRLNCIGSHIKL